MGRITDALEARGLELPQPLQIPPGVEVPFAWVRVHGDRAFVSGHGALAPDGTPAGPFGAVPSEVSLEDAQASATRAGLAILSSLQTALGDLDRVEAWLMVNGFVNADRGYAQTTAVLNPLSNLIHELYGPEAGSHARTAIGVSTVPLNLPVVASVEVAIRP